MKGKEVYMGCECTFMGCGQSYETILSAQRPSKSLFLCRQLTKTAFLHVFFFNLLCQLNMYLVRFVFLKQKKLHIKYGGNTSTNKIDIVRLYLD